MDRQLIVLLKAPRVGAVKTRLAAALGSEGACAAYGCLVDTLVRRLTTVEEVELRFSPDDAAAEVVHWRQRGWTLAPQGQGDLGTRLARAFADAFGRGRRRVVVIGSDCPYVLASDVDAAWLALGNTDVVIGPARDGGYWLMGLRAAQPELFSGIPWSTELVMSETMARCQALGLRVHRLQELADIDTEQDWREFKQAHG